MDYYASQFTGLVVAGAGGSAISRPWREALRRATDAGIVVIRSSRTLNGLTVIDDVMDGESGTIPSYTLPPQKASVLLKLALTRSRDRTEVERMFREY
ncbi:hypothetical protein [Billgrantia zhangzhouensis]|uniref:hypothetical protein n=1 Tax=Billgrantia zhangzhouensis TaxID=2733481 RepID=UPI00387EB4E3